MDDRIRVSDADRERVTARLREHFAEGRLSQEELDERLSAALRENLKRRKEQARGRTAAGEDLAAREAGVSAGEPDFRRNPGPKSGGTGRPGAGRGGS